MKRVLLVVAYDGTAYSGWQLQPNGDTIEGQLNTHLSALLNEEIAVIGASRTDAGVHARCNLAVFDTQARIPAEKISYALNQRLPEDIRIVSSREVAPDFHPRKMAVKKTYEYQIYQAEFPSPLHRLYSYFTYTPLDIGKMREAAAHLVGEHDFFSFSTYKPEVESTVRTISEIQVIAEPEEPCGVCGTGRGPAPRLITIRVTGNGFLYHMVRIIAGTLLEVGRGRLAPERIPEILAARDREQAGPTAPANGLILVNYEWEEQTETD